MRRFYVEYIYHAHTQNRYLYVFAYSAKQIEEMFREYEIVAIDETE